ncbi:DNA cytosine methyltransferase [Bacteroides caecimuris]|jgi:DNA (cytosine-5)-methyltransferase 1|uniref:DNA cytosine methyltransferase n=1 Tax=Bacteroides caecimuris TaxID=1796613 RepID=UPI002570BF15|nr:DNA cytosine methyltransferase [Bacteroides caecimuris]
MLNTTLWGSIMCNCLEIFSGAGGLATGIGLSGVNHTAFVEWNSDACKTLRTNYDEKIVFEGDIRTYDFSQCMGVDIIAGGPPCQPFSMGGKARGNLDERDMFPAAIRSIRDVLPRAFFFENVKGLLRPNFKSYLDYILLQLRFPTIRNSDDDCSTHIDNILRHSKSIPLSQQYDVQIHLVNAANYGVPQKRERVIIVGFRRDLEVSWSLPSITHSCDSLLWDKYVTNSYWDNHGISPTNEEFAIFAKMKNALSLKYGFFPPELFPWRTIRDALINIPSVGDENHFPSEHIIRDGAREYPGHTGSPVDDPAKTVKAGSHGVPGGENMIKFPDGTLRYFTIFEAKRLQTFPDEYRIVGSWTEAMRQLGNAVPVKLAQIISSSILACL